MIKALLNAGQEIAGDDCRIVVAPKTEHAAQEFGENIGEKMKRRTLFCWLHRYQGRTLKKQLNWFILNTVQKL